ncbi:MAG: SH3 domain-containing protein [Clostridiales bacterium]|nr:SH3 domain-containing protein [Clostridiales bacterium]
MKKTCWLAIAVVIALMLGCITSAHAEIIPAYGEGQIGLQAAVLCSELTLREKPDASSKAIKTLKYRDLIIVVEQKNGWARCVLGDAENSPSGWVNAEYIVVDPAWYRTDRKTYVYAWNELTAPKVALLEKNTEFLDPDTFLPILKDEGEWLIVSLRGAAGWIHKNELDLSASKAE